jgi:hypothetical protein
MLEDGELHIREVPTPVPAYEEAVVRITAAGVCHSDLHVLKGDWNGVPRTGAFGHEGVRAQIGMQRLAIASSSGSAAAAVDSGVARATTASVANRACAVRARASLVRTQSSFCCTRSRSS